MTEYQINLNGEQVKELLVNDEGLKGLVETVLNQVLKDQLTEQIGAGRYEPTGQSSITVEFAVPPGVSSFRTTLAFMLWILAAGSIGSRTSVTGSRAEAKD